MASFLLSLLVLKNNLKQQEALFVKLFYDKDLKVIFMPFVTVPYFAPFRLFRHFAISFLVPSFLSFLFQFVFLRTLKNIHQ